MARTSQVRGSRVFLRALLFLFQIHRQREPQAGEERTFGWFSWVPGATLWGSVAQICT